MLKILFDLERHLDRFAERTGHLVAWLIPILAITAFIAVILRYLFNQNFIWLQDTVTYIHAFILMLCMGYTQYCNRHVRVDIFYRTLPPKRRHLIDLVGNIALLVPISITILVFGFEYALRAWLFLEKSLEVGGLPLVFILKSLIPLMALFLLMQSVATAIRNLRHLLTDQEQDQ